MKWLLDVKLLEFFGDFRFSISVYNVPEDFIFRTRNEESCREWVATLISAKDANSSANSSSQTHSASEAVSGNSFPDLLDEQNKPSQSEWTEFPDLDMNSGAPAPTAPPLEQSPNMDAFRKGHDKNAYHSGSSSNSNGSEKKLNNTSSNASAAQPSKQRLSIKELRAIAHGAGYDTRGMERLDLEKIAAYYAPVSEKNAQYSQHQQQQQQQTPRRQNSQETQQQRLQKAKEEMENKRKREELERVRKQKEDERIRGQQTYVQRKRDEFKKREEEVKQQTEVTKKAEEMKRKQQQSQQHQQQQQQQQQPQQQWNPTASHNARNATQATATNRRQQGPPAFESTRFFNTGAKAGESGPRRKQAFTSQNQQHRQPSAQPQQYTPPPDPPVASTSVPHPPPPQQKPATPNNSNRRDTDPTSPLNQKYAKVMAANQSNPSAQDEQTIIANIKRNILITWALVPPQYNMLRPIDQLLSSIQTVCPPFAGIATHEYFSKWKAINHQELLLGSAMGGADEAKLKKAVRKLRVFLHPDRLPREFDAKQTFVCKMLWDVSNDAYEEFVKHKEDLDWIKS